MQSDKVAKKPKPSVSTPEPLVDSKEDQNESDGVAPGQKSSVKREKKSFNFIGDVLYSVSVAYRLSQSVSRSKCYRGMGGAFMAVPIWPVCLRLYQLETFAGAVQRFRFYRCLACA